MSDLPGLDTTRLAGWLPSAIPDAGDDLRASLIDGGRSNLTYLLTDGTSTWVLRRPPLGHVLATAHDMHREYRVMSALRTTAVPVPSTFAYCDDTGPLGVPFYLMEQMAGTPYRHRAELSSIGPVRTRAVAEQLVDTLVALHAVDPASVGLADLGRPTGFLARQVGRWSKQLGASRTRELPAAAALRARLLLDVPTSTASTIVHGDYRLDNLLIGTGGRADAHLPDDSDRVTAVLDWEMATLGDPLTDLALMLTYHRLAALGVSEVVSDAPLALGYLTEEEIVRRYAGASAHDVSHLGWHLGLAAFKLAAVLEGIHFRYLAGQSVGEGYVHIGEAVCPLLEAGLEAIEDGA